MTNLFTKLSIYWCSLIDKHSPIVFHASQYFSMYHLKVWQVSSFSYFFFFFFFLTDCYGYAAGLTLIFFWFLLSRTIQHIQKPRISRICTLHNSSTRQYANSLIGVTYLLLLSFFFGYQIDLNIQSLCPFIMTYSQPTFLLSMTNTWSLYFVLYKKNSSSFNDHTWSWNVL